MYGDSEGKCNGLTHIDGHLCHGEDENPSPFEDSANRVKNIGYPTSVNRINKNSAIHKAIEQHHKLLEKHGVHNPFKGK